VVGADRFNREDDAGGRYWSLVHLSRSRWLYDMRCGVTDGAVRVREPVGVKVCLLERGAEEKQHDTHNCETKVIAPVRRPIGYPTWAESSQH